MTKPSLAAKTKTRSGINSGIDVLECVAASPRSMGLLEISQAVGMAKSSVHQLLDSLAERGYVQRHPDRKYSIGIRAWEVGCKATFVEIGRVCEPYMAELVRTVQEGVSLGLLDGTQMVCIQISESQQAVRVHNPVGERNPAHCLSAGLSLLAMMPDENVMSLMPKRLAKVTSKTIIAREELLTELRRVRTRGYSVCRGTWRMDVAGVAVAIRGIDGRGLAAISVALPLERLTAAHLQKISAGLLNAAAGIERQLGSPIVKSLHLEKPTATRLSARQAAAAAGISL